MGQYYKPIVLSKEDKQKPIAHLLSYDFDSGSKLMEHSWLENNFVATFLSLIEPGGEFEGHPIVWAGYYADKEKDENGEFLLNLYGMCIEDMEDSESTNGLPITKVNPTQKNGEDHYQFFINEDTKEFVDVEFLPQTGNWNDNSPMYVHPLPLLTSEGNGRGSGDYHYEDEMIGSWSRNVIRLSNEKPSDEYKQIYPCFLDEWEKDNPKIDMIKKSLSKQKKEMSARNIILVNNEYYVMKRELTQRYKRMGNRLKMVVKRLALSERI